MTQPQGVPQVKGAASGLFLVLAGLGAVVMSVAWCWYGLAHFEEMTEQSKAVSAGTTMAGTGAWLGIPPVALAHGIGLVVLVAVAPRGRRLWPGFGAAALGVAVASIVGIVVAQVLWQGDLFGMSATMQPEYIP